MVSRSSVRRGVGSSVNADADGVPPGREQTPRLSRDRPPLVTSVTLSMGRMSGLRFDVSLTRPRLSGSCRCIQTRGIAPRQGKQCRQAASPVHEPSQLSERAYACFYQNRGRRSSALGSAPAIGPVISSRFVDKRSPVAKRPIARPSDSKPHEAPTPCRRTACAGDHRGRSCPSRG
jgi:hypothetical protein